MKRPNERDTRRIPAHEGSSIAGEIARRSTHATSCFVLEVDRRAILAFTARSLLAAQTRVQEPWLVEELSRLNSDGKPVLKTADERVVRNAYSHEAADVEINRARDKARGEDSKYGFAFLIPIDPPSN